MPVTTSALLSHALERLPAAWGHSNGGGLDAMQALHRAALELEPDGPIWRRQLDAANAVRVVLGLKDADMESSSYRTITNYNDRPETTLADILAAFGAAKKMAEEFEEAERKAKERR
jgi:hypothetical protein